jgi:FMN-dependent NADH-azoreductase
MSRILLVLSSPRGESSYSTRVARALVERLRAASPGAVVAVRDLGADPLPHVGEDFVAALGTPPEARTSEQQAAIARSDQLVEELLTADTLVIASAMINFAPTSTLKAWLDHVARAGRTFRYTAAGTPEGLVRGKKVYLVEAKGGVYSAGAAKAYDFQEPYLRHMLAYLGMTDVDVIAVEGTIFGPEEAERAVRHALGSIGITFGEVAAAA